MGLACECCCHQAINAVLLAADAAGVQGYQDKPDISSGQQLYCQAMTQKELQCSRSGTKLSGLCWQHDAMGTRVWRWAGEQQGGPCVEDGFCSGICFSV